MSDDLTKCKCPACVARMGIIPVQREEEWSVSAVGSKEFCEKVAAYIESLRAGKRNL